MPTLEYPEKSAAQVISCNIPVSTKVDGEKKATEFSAELPKSLADAIALEGGDEVFKRYINSKVIALQGEQRTKMQAGAEGAPTRGKAKYMDQLGL